MFSNRGSYARRPCAGSILVGWLRIVRSFMIVYTSDAYSLGISTNEYESRIRIAPMAFPGIPVSPADGANDILGLDLVLPADAQEEPDHAHFCTGVLKRNLFFLLHGFRTALLHLEF